MAGTIHRILGIGATLLGFLAFFGGIVLVIYGLEVRQNETDKPLYAREAKVVAAAERILDYGTWAIVGGAVFLVLGPWSTLRGARLRFEAFEREHRIVPDRPDETVIVRPSFTRGASPYLWVVLGLAGLLLAVGGGVLLFQLDPTGSFALDGDREEPGSALSIERPGNRTDDGRLTGLVQGGRIVGPGLAFANHTFDVHSQADRITVVLAWRTTGPAPAARLRMEVFLVLEDGREQKLAEREGLPQLEMNATNKDAGTFLGGKRVRVQVQLAADGASDQSYQVRFRNWDDP